MGFIHALLLAFGWYAVKKHKERMTPPPVTTPPVDTTPPVTDQPPIIDDTPPEPIPTEPPVIQPVPDPTPLPPIVPDPVPDPIDTQPIGDPVPVPDPVIIPPPDPVPPIVVSPYQIQAASPEVADVQAAIDRSEEGGVVIVPPGTPSWAYTLHNDGKFVRVIAPSGVMITHDAVGQTLIELHESARGSVRLDGFTIKAGAWSSALNGAAVITGYPVPGGLPMVLIRNRFDVRSDNCLRWFMNRGLITQNYFAAQIYAPLYGNNASLLRHKPGDWEPDSWTSRSYYGIEDVNGDRNLYVENNTGVLLFEGIDNDDNARTVVRNNVLISTPVLIHGNDTSGTGGRSIEGYRNRFVYDPSIGGLDGPPNFNGFTVLRGGTALLWGNDIPAYVDTGWWGPSAWKPSVIFMCENLRRHAGPYACYLGPYPIPHQVGRGMNNQSEPVYLWGNTGSGNYNTPSIQDYSPNECGADARSAAEFIQVGRDVILGAKPDYSPFIYPHPLTEDRA